jgi:MinD-like ATPase involved in chromosome partitioning or flagellar assembly
MHTADAPVRLILAGPPDSVRSLHAWYAGDSRFQVLTTATSPDDLRAKMASTPEAIVVDGLMFENAAGFVQALATYQGVCFLMLLDPRITGAEIDAARRIPCVREVIRETPNFGELGGRVYDAVLATRRAATGAGRSFGGLRQSNASAIGFRAIAVWSAQGGCGKTTIATALALEAVSRNLPALLVGLGAPDPIPLTLRLRSDPGIVTWRGNPAGESFKAHVQTHPASRLDVLAGFPTPLALTSYLEDAFHPAKGLAALVSTAALAGYSVVVLDVSAQELAPAALSAANTLIMPVRPDTTGLLAARVTTTMIFEQMAGQHRIPPEGVYVVLNRVHEQSIPAPEFSRYGGNLCRNFPPVAATIPDDREIEAAINQSAPPYYRSRVLAQAAQTLGGLLFASTLAPRSEVAKPAKTFNLGPIRIKV